MFRIHVYVDLRVFLSILRKNRSESALRQSSDQQNFAETSHTENFELYLVGELK